MRSQLMHPFIDFRFAGLTVFLGLAAVSFAAPPSITTQPGSATVDRGTLASFSVLASGTAPLSYQWYKNNGLISGETASTLTYSSAQLSDAASYKVTVSNGEGSVDSANAVLTVVGDYSAWVTFRGIATGHDAFDADPDADGICNLLEYFLGLDPTTSDTLGLPTGVISGSDFVFRFTRAKAVTGVSYRVLTSSDLAAWSPVSGVSLESSTDTLETYAVSIPLTGTKNFVRLEVRSGSSTAATIPIGFMNFAIVGASGGTPATTPFGIPLTDMGVPSAGLRAGFIDSFSSTSLTDSLGGWTGNLAASSAPWLSRLTSGSYSGKLLDVTANTTTTLTLSGGDLTTFGLTGGTDTFELSPLDTLFGLFGSSSVQGGTSSSAADNVQVRSGTSWLSYYFDTSLGFWRRTIGPATNSNNVRVRPESGVLVVRRSTALTLTFTGRVPAFPYRAPINNASTTVVHTGFPTDTTLGALAIQTLLSGWRDSSDASGGDQVGIFDGTTWVLYVYNGSYWQPVSGTPTNSDSIAIPAGALLTIQRPGSTTGATDLVRSLPYSLAANAPPTVAITAPTNGTVFGVPASFTLSATASDSDGAITKVEFYRDGTLLGQATTAPYEFAVTGLGAGLYSFTAKATDNTDAAATSSAVTITVSSAGPVITLTKPADAILIP